MDTSSSQPSRRLATLLRDQIASGALVPGERLPSERHLAEQHRVARNTAREAVRLLVEEGLVDVEHGRGSFVRTAQPVLRLGLQRNPDQGESLPQQQHPSALTAVNRSRLCTMTAPDEVAATLGLQPGEVVTCQTTQLIVGDQIHIITTTYSRGGNAAEELAVWAREEISARVPTAAEVEQMALPGGVAILEVVRTSLDREQRPLAVRREIMRSDRAALDYLFPLAGDARTIA